MSKKFTENESIKRIANRKILLGSAAILIACVFIGITSFVPFVITGEKLSSEKFWTDELIIIAIIIFSIVAVMYIGQASNAQNPQSQIAKAKVEFRESLLQITNINAFSQWIKKVLQPEDLQAIKERELRRIGIDDYTVLYLDDNQIKAMAKGAQKFEYHYKNISETRYYSKISQKQADYILSLKDGVKKIHMVEPGYYLTVSSIEVSKTDSEKSGRESIKKTAKLAFSLVSKIILVLIPAVIFAALARDLSAGDTDMAQAFSTFFSRVWALISSSFMGYIIGCQMNDIDADYIQLRVRVHKRYIQDKDFKPLTQQEMARKDFIERVKKDNEEYTKSLNLKDQEEMKINLPIEIKSDK